MWVAPSIHGLGSWTEYKGERELNTNQHSLARMDRIPSNGAVVFDHSNKQDNQNTTVDKTLVS